MFKFFLFMFRVMFKKLYLACLIILRKYVFLDMGDLLVDAVFTGS